VSLLAFRDRYGQKRTEEITGLETPTLDPGHEVGVARLCLSEAHKSEKIVIGKEERDCFT
jgi:hypothetical protein